ncbi:hypothetical protein IBX65_09375, partial [Candidatus Aerophobetes bacterium]|nr:hypothetical protein [Candidatus Aerophobetes bacterium]
GVAAALLLATGFAGTGWAAEETVVSFGLVESLSAASATLTSNFNKGGVVYVRVNVGGQVGGSSIAMAKDDTPAHTTNWITFTVYDDGTFPDDNANDGYYWGRFTIVDGDYPFTDDANDILGLASGETATISCNLDGVEPTGTHTITAYFAPPDHTKPSIDTFEVNPNPFSPNADGIQDETNIFYSLSDNISTQLQVRLEIRDTSAVIVKTLVDAETQNTGTLYTYSWDGTYDDGTPAADGNYICRIMALDGSGNSVESTLGIIIDTQPPQIFNVSVSPTPFSPNDDTIKDTTTISFSLSGAAASNNKVEIRDSLGILVRTFDDEISPSGGADGVNTVIWDGKDWTGTVVPDGSYFYEIWAQDAAGNLSFFTGIIRVDTTPPETALQILDNMKTHLSPFNVSDLGATPPTGLYISDVQVGGEWQTTDPSGITKVELIIGGNVFAPQNPHGNWQGWYLYWTPPASDGTYTVRVRAVDNVGNDTGSSGASSTIIYDNSPPTSHITSPPDGTVFSSSTLTISGTASDGADGAGVQEVQVQVTNISTSTVIISFDSSSVIDASLGGDWSTWEYVFTPPDAGSPPVNYLVECRATDNLFDPLSPTSSSHIQASPHSITVTYDTQNPPHHPVDLRDDGVSILTGHYFGITNVLTCTQEHFAGLIEVRFEYRVEPSGTWQVIGSDAYTATPSASYVPEVIWDTTGLASDVTYSFRAVAIGSEIPSGVISGCRIDNDAPSAPYNLRDDGVLITPGHVFGRNNVFSANADVEDASLVGVRFEYRDYTALSSWISIGTDTSPQGNEFSVLWDTSALNTTHSYWVRATAIDVASNETSSSAITNCSIRLSPPVFQSLTKDKDAYKNSDTITLTANLDAAGYTMAADFSEVDSEYGEGTNMEQVTDNLDSTYTIQYTISLFNSFISGSTVVVTATDLAGNQATSSITVTLDNIAPTAAISSPSSGVTLSGSVTFIISDTGAPDADVESFILEYSPTGLSSWSTCPSQTQGTWNPGATSAILFDTSSLGDGSYDFRCKLEDTAGNVGYTEPIYNVALDNGPPPVPTSLTAQAISGARVYLTWQASSPEDDVDYYKLYRSTLPYSYTFTYIAPLSKGTVYPLSYVDGPLSDATTYYYHVTSIDAQGNESAFSNQASCVTDGTAPVFTASIQKDKEAYKNEDTIHLTAFLDAAGYTLVADFSEVDSRYGIGANVESVTDHGNKTYSISYTISPDNTFLSGSTVVVTASDTAGNVATSSVTITLDNIAPVFIAPTLSDKSVYKNTDTITLTCELDASGYTVSVNFGSIDTTYSSGKEEVQDGG